MTPIEEQTIYNVLSLADDYCKDLTEKYRSTEIYGISGYNGYIKYVVEDFHIYDGKIRCHITITYPNGTEKMVSTSYSHVMWSNPYD